MKPFLLIVVALAGGLALYLAEPTGAAPGPLGPSSAVYASEEEGPAELTAVTSERVVSERPLARVDRVGSPLLENTSDQEREAPPVAARSRAEVRSEIQDRIARPDEPQRRCPISLVLTLERAEIDPAQLGDEELNELYDSFRTLERATLEDIARLQESSGVDALEDEFDPEVERQTDALWKAFVTAADGLAAKHGTPR